MLEALKEILRRNKPEGAEGLWTERCQGLFKNHESARLLGSPKFRKEALNKAVDSGRRLIKGITPNHGEETAESLLREMDGASLKSQLDLLTLSQRVNPTYIINALASTPEETKTSWEYLFSPQDELYRYILGDILNQRDGQEYFSTFKERVEGMKLSPGMDIPHNRNVVWRRMLEMALDKGLPFMIESLDFVPPTEIFPDNIDERLVLEKEIRATGEKPVEREIIFSGWVQGVGFRGHCWGIAKKWGVKGFARNERDGTVTVLLQGDLRRLDRFWMGFEKTLSPNEKAQIEKDRTLGEKVYKDFEIL